MGARRGRNKRPARGWRRGVLPLALGSIRVRLATVARVIVQSLKRRQSLNRYKSIKQKEEHAMFEVPERLRRATRGHVALLTTSRSSLCSSGARTGCPSPTRQGRVARCSFRY
ncbi:receptor-like cytosolic serine/threonine-protein kinase RBK1 [Iris pallida]|uniref:Receptor-like cytosolic serine/threonine-protein kinase RBK1 n=1 Tax=Iris pallida TaxID=29817 RepID=A0AAX6I8Y9_IRIPA|nr:receptor-like cytosolic serine/threonine-protein kinase RBK1 [Iris pallida]